MTEEEALEKLKEIDANTDTEVAHIDGDTLAVVALRELGWTRFADSYKESMQGWWYA